MRNIVKTVVVLGATAAVLAPAAAAPAASRTTTAPLGTYGFGRAGVIGEAGVAAGVWRSFAVRPGFAGDDLSVTYQRRTTAYAAEKQVYTAAFTTVADAQGECLAVGAAGVARKVWVSFRCQTGFVPSYTLYVR
ncbi:hypothetical protein [Actinoplanes awajinensis]|uniref:Secreted protein n=1 Tax=Actinoplanes awajinensis subsp. mycoplanecinus TaxID=135947 RepID=A0A101JCS8_9ACTN|nr:hypothetical protein [Actinoplanes awajinensis]KUL24398.1 hypothetical protein ADL15_43650 [Actinoplanes awajinensis subsp. mycoplanecinus]